MDATRSGPDAKQPADDRYERIYAAVAAIPRGCVASYGQVAEQAGLPRGARLVGRALAQCTTRVPWHRVLNAAGRLSLPPGSAAYREQVRRLEREGVTVRDGKVGPGFFRWQPDGLDELLWGPASSLPARRRRPAATTR
jgi:methylated-DNA-protein-cysteine methyltransferase-like protein